ncbi:SPFH domain-containing protein, partial [Acinetobacter baumannii]|nr:SPFH domain-containing protein [Acinetobacter baumannii]
MIVLFGIILLLLAMVAISGVRIVPESYVYVVERLGKYSQTLESGLSFINPLIDRVAKQVTLKEQVVDFDPQGVITKDNAT